MSEFPYLRIRRGSPSFYGGIYRRQSIFVYRIYTGRANPKDDEEVRREAIVEAKEQHNGPSYSYLSSCINTVNTQFFTSLNQLCQVRNINIVPV